MQTDYIERRIKLNRNTTAIIKSKKAKDAEIYTNTITLVQETADVKALQFSTRDELEAAIKQIDLDEDQMSIGITIDGKGIHNNG